MLIVNWQASAFLQGPDPPGGVPVRRPDSPRQMRQKAEAKEVCFVF